MVSGRALFPGSTVEEELKLIFQILGPPDMPRPTSIVHDTFLSMAPRLTDGVSLLTSFLTVNLLDIFLSVLFS